MRKKKIVFVICAASILILSAIVFVIIQNRNNANGSLLSYPTTNELHQSQEPQTNVIQRTITNNVEPNTSIISHYSAVTGAFIYKTKESYNTREEVFQEKADLLASYKVYIDGKPQAMQQEALRVCQSIEAVLDDFLQEIPPSEDEIMQDKISQLNSEINFRKHFAHVSSEILSANPTNETFIADAQKFQRELEQAQDIEKQYLDGKITIDRALELLGVVY